MNRRGIKKERHLPLFNQSVIMSFVNETVILHGFRIERKKSGLVLKVLVNYPVVPVPFGIIDGSVYLVWRKAAEK